MVGIQKQPCSNKDLRWLFFHKFNSLNNKDVQWSLGTQRNLQDPLGVWEVKAFPCGKTLVFTVLWSLIAVLKHTFPSSPLMFRSDMTDGVCVTTRSPWKAPNMFTLCAIKPPEDISRTWFWVRPESSLSCWGACSSWSSWAFRCSKSTCTSSFSSLGCLELDGQFKMLSSASSQRRSSQLDHSCCLPPDVGLCLSVVLELVKAVDDGSDGSSSVSREIQECSEEWSSVGLTGVQCDTESLWNDVVRP